MGLDASEVFIHRNIANLVPNTDLNVMSVIEYAVTHLHVKHIIVCGHYNCGGVQASLAHEDLGLLNPWLRNIRDVYRLHEKELDRIREEEPKYRRLCELNCLEQARNVLKTATVQKSYFKYKYPIVHAWIFDLRDGLLKDLNFDFAATLEGIKKIYNLEHENDKNEKKKTAVKTITDESATAEQKA
jgi:carbonic anhydrase